MKTNVDFKMIFLGKREYEKDNKKHYMYSMLQVNDENNWGQSTTYFSDENIDTSKLVFMKPCLCTLEVAPGSKFNKLVTIKPCN